MYNTACAAGVCYVCASEYICGGAARGHVSGRTAAATGGRLTWTQPPRAAFLQESYNTTGMSVRGAGALLGYMAGRGEMRAGQAARQRSAATSQGSSTGTMRQSAAAARSRCQT